MYYCFYDRSVLKIGTGQELGIIIFIIGIILFLFRFVKSNHNAQSSEAFATLRPLVTTIGELLSDLRQLQISLTLEKVRLICTYFNSLIRFIQSIFYKLL